MAEAGNKGKMNIRMRDEQSLQMFKIVLAYEAGVRGRTMGQACADLVMEAADLDSYPQEIRDRLDEIAAEASRQAVLESLSESRDPQE